MDSTVIGILVNAFDCVYNAMADVFIGSNMTFYVLGIVVACLISRFIILPVFRGRYVNVGSDKARPDIMDAEYRRL